MRVVKYVPARLYGFVQGTDKIEFFFHIRAFKWGDFRPTAPPIVGEEVEVEYDVDGAHHGQAPKARAVFRLHEPRASYGVVEEFHEARGYGFIRTDDGRTHYLHRSEMTDGRLPLAGMEVTFFEGFRQGRTRACYVTLVSNGARST
jgi:cold shock CspA family protein